jgi:hypothetical protein
MQISVDHTPAKLGSFSVFLVEHIKSAATDDAAAAFDDQKLTSEGFTR